MGLIRNYIPIVKHACLLENPTQRQCILLSGTAVPPVMHEAASRLCVHEPDTFLAARGVTLWSCSAADLKQKGFQKCLHNLCVIYS